MALSPRGSEALTERESRDIKLLCMLAAYEDLKEHLNVWIDKVEQTAQKSYQEASGPIIWTDSSTPVAELRTSQLGEGRNLRDDREDSLLGSSFSAIDYVGLGHDLNSRSIPGVGDSGSCSDGENGQSMSLLSIIQTPRPQGQCRTFLGDASPISPVSKVDSLDYTITQTEEMSMCSPSSMKRKYDEAFSPVNMGVNDNADISSWTPIEAETSARDNQEVATEPQCKKMRARDAHGKEYVLVSD